VAGGKNRVAIALRMAAQALGRTNSPLALFYRRIKSRIGGLGAITATAHKLARLVYRMLKYGREYVKQSMEAYETKMKANLERSPGACDDAPALQRFPLISSTVPHTHSTGSIRLEIIADRYLPPHGCGSASASGDKTVKLWDVASGKERATLQGHTQAVMSVAFSPDGKTLASASNDKTVKLWDVATGK
jgi:hypothetical protein